MTGTDNDRPALDLDKGDYTLGENYSSESQQTPPAGNSAPEDGGGFGEEEEEEEEENSGSEQGGQGQGSDDENNGEALVGAAGFGERVYASLGLAPDGTFDFEGEQVHWDDLGPEDQLEVGRQVLESAQGNDYRAVLKPEEIKLIDLIRKQGPAAAAEALLGAPAAAVQAVQALSDDDVNLREIRRQLDGASEEEIQQELASRKTSPLYQRRTEALRGSLQTEEAQTVTQARQQEFAKEANLIATAATQAKDVLGFLLNDEVREYVLEDLIERGSNGVDSKFVESLQNPDKLFRLAWLDKYAEPMMARYDQDIKEAEKRGFNQALGRAPQEPRRSASGRGGAIGGPNKPGSRADSEEYISSKGEKMIDFGM